MAGTVRVHGLKELNRAFGKASKDLQRELRAGLKEAAEPVAAEARSNAARFGARTAAGIKPGARAGAAFVRQGNRKTTGKRPDFGRLQMQTVLLPALAAKEDAVVAEVEKLIDRIADKGGF
jgi:hypothetical protein